MTGMGVGARFHGPQPVSITAADRQKAGRKIKNTIDKIRHCNAFAGAGLLFIRFILFEMKYHDYNIV
jgi:hypothetical protein